MNRIRVLYDAEGGAAGAPPEGTPPAEPQAPGAAALETVGTLVGNPPEKPPEAPKVMPKYASQLSPEARTKYKDALEAMGEISLTDTFTDLMETKGKLERAILMPNKDDPEDIKRFMKDMGIPESPAGYEIDEKVLGPEVTKLLTEQALKTGMTKKQAQTMHGFVNALMKNGMAGVAEATKQRAETFDTRMTEAMGSPEAADAATKYAKKFIIRFGDKDTIKSLETTGLMYNTTFMRKIAEFEKALGDTKYVEGNPPITTTPAGERKGAFGTYNKAFEERYGGQR